MGNTHDGQHSRWVTCSAFAFTVDGQRIVFTGDIEIPSADRARLIAFCGEGSALICDAQYAPSEYPDHRGWGHSTNVHAAELARDAGVERLILTHHDPNHDDAKIDEMVEQAQAIFPSTVGARNRMVVAEG